MKTRIKHYWSKISGSFLFVPLALIAFAIVLTIAFLFLDRNVTYEMNNFNFILYSGGAESARAILTTIAASMITVTGTVFSITIVALTLASSQFGPRMLRNFMHNRTNQVVLGIFLATFTFCLILIRTVKSDGGVDFIPNISITFAILLVLVNVVVLIFFINHIATSIQADNLVHVVYQELIKDLNVLYPQSTNDSKANENVEMSLEEKKKFSQKLEQSGIAIKSNQEGYVQAVDVEGLINWLSNKDLQMNLIVRPGDSVYMDQIIAYVDVNSKKEQSELGEHLHKYLIFGSKKTPEQDPEYALQQLVEIAVRSLSSGINDPFTAMTCVDKIGASIVYLSTKNVDDNARAGSDGKLRLLASTIDFEGFLDNAFNQIRQNGKDSIAVLIRMLETLSKIKATCKNEVQSKAIAKHAKLVWEQRETSNFLKDDTDCLNERFENFNSI